ncbi:GNAT family protein [Sporosarcina thermotolerans]|uniref:GNAT family protein n=1 Tax=Sporosarcina thermotolerans TaxID=633404 RepID=A0AAW9ABR6_9BACL|nr:GNAT family protein [Sporosarcina thermotolerans]MDW0116553.1 GNAT family protein [Sporosarcina thermotolerans]
MFTYQINDEIELRLLEVRHAEQLFNLTDKSRDSLREWLPWIDFTKTVEDSRGFILGTMQQFSRNDGFQAGIWHKGELAGVIGLHGINWSNKSTSIGYWLGKDHEGHGLMTQACEAIIEYCFTELGLNRIEIRTATENKKSMAIPNRLGFQQEGHIKQAEWLYNKFVDHFVFGMVKEDWRNR